MKKTSLILFLIFFIGAANALDFKKISEEDFIKKHKYNDRALKNSNVAVNKEAIQYLLRVQEEQTRELAKIKKQLRTLFNHQKNKEAMHPSS